MSGPAGIRQYPMMERFVVLYHDSRWADDEMFWCAVQTREEANYEVYRREQHGWTARIIEPVSYAPGELATWQRMWEARPKNTPKAVWSGAVALAMVRHRSNPYPQPQDERDALTVLAAAAPWAL